MPGNGMHRRSSLAAAAALLAFCLAGCEQTHSNEDFIPSEDASLKALETALLAWQKGTAVGPIPDTTPVVHVTDSFRTAHPDRALQNWKILGPTPGNAPRCFAVQLSLGGPQEDRRERFIVVGIDPLWVFRHEDYDLLAHWEHPMPAQTPSTSEAAAVGTPSGPDAGSEKSPDDESSSQESGRQHD